MPQSSFRQEKVLVLMRLVSASHGLAGVLSEIGLNPVVCRDLTHCCEQLDEQTWVLLIDEELIGPDHVPQLAAALQNQPAWSDLPILVLTSRHESTYNSPLFDSLNGTVVFIQRPLLRETLSRTLKLAIRGRQRQFQIRDMLRELENDRLQAEARAEEALAQQQAQCALAEQLRQERDLIAAMLNSTDALVAVADVEGRLTLFNKGCERTSGYSESEVKGRVFWDFLIPQEQRPTFKARWKIILTGTFPKRSENGWVAKNGSHRLISWSNTALFGANGDVEFVVGTGVDITEQTVAERALRESEQRSRALVTASSETIYRMSPDWTELLQLVSRGIIANTEKPSRNWLQDYIPPEDRPQVETAVKKAIRTRSIFELEHRVVRADGTLGWTFSRAVPLLDASGAIVEWFGAATDVTERRRAEEALRNSEQRLRLALNSAQLGSFEWRIQADEAIWDNERIFQIFGLKPGAQPINLASFCKQVIHPDDLELFKSELADRMRSNLAFQGRYRIRRQSDGQIRWIGYFAHYQYEGDVPVRLVGVVEDITERKQAEEALRIAQEELAETNTNLEKLVRQRTVQLQEANDHLISEIEQRKLTESYLRASEHRYRDLVQVSPDAICICRNHRIIFVNRAAEQLFGAVSSLQLLDRPVNELFQVNQSTRGSLFIQKMLQLENPSLSTFETQIVRLDGEVRDVDVAWSPFREGGETSIQLLLHDATERKLIERQILKAVDKERELLGRELHDGLCQLLTATKFKVGLIERKLVRNGYVDPSDARALELDINRAIEQAREMARGLNPVSLVARGLGAALNDLAANVEKSFQVRCGCNLCEEVTIDDQATAHHLYRIAQEAVNNAVRHAKPKCIQVNLQTDGNAIALEVLDDGGGFQSPVNSSGMGLRNIRARAELIGALIHIDSNPGGGTMVGCRLQQVGKSSSPNPLAS